MLIDILYLYIAPSTGTQINHHLSILIAKPDLNLCRKCH
jgi:hypothetical protein